MNCGELVLRAGITSKKIGYFLSSENKAGKFLTSRRWRESVQTS